MTLSTIAYGSGFRSEDVRRLLHTAVSGQWGVAGPGDLKVSPTSPPSNRVVIAVGGGVLKNGDGTFGQKPWASSNPGQSYQVSNDQALLVTVAPNTGSSPVVRRLYLTVRDPQYAESGWLNGMGQSEYVYTAWDLNEAGATRPRLHLANITLPPNTATVDASMIMDWRQPLQPRTQTLRAGGQGPTTPERLIAAAGVWKTFPTTVRPNISIPEWATLAKIRADVSYVFRGTASTLKSVYPPQAPGDVAWQEQIAVNLGGALITNSTVTPDGLTGPGLPFQVNTDRPSRAQAFTYADLDVTAWRGSTRKLQLLHMTIASSASANPFYFDSSCAILFEVDFVA